MRSKPVILIVEDQKGFRVVFRDILEHYGFDVILADDGEMALELARSAIPDVILLDMMLPKLSGLEVLGLLRAGKATQEIPVIVLSVLEEYESKDRAMASGADDYLTKSNFSKEEMLAKIKALLKGRLGKEAS